MKLKLPRDGEIRVARFVPAPECAGLKSQFVYIWETFWVWIWANCLCNELNCIGKSQAVILMGSLERCGESILGEDKSQGRGGDCEMHGKGMMCLRNITQVFLMNRLLKL